MTNEHGWLAVFCGMKKSCLVWPGMVVPAWQASVGPNVYSCTHKQTPVSSQTLNEQHVPTATTGLPHMSVCILLMSLLEK